MTIAAVSIPRPERWDHPLDPNMDPKVTQWLLRLLPFSAMDPTRFSEDTPLPDILRNDCRLLTLSPGEVIFQEGQYGGSAYLVLSGTVRAFLERLLTESELQRRRAHRLQRPSWLSLFRLAPKVKSGNQDRRTRQRQRGRQRNIQSDGEEQVVQLRIDRAGARSRIYLQDIPGVLSSHQTSSIHTGELFGEIAAATRTAREFTAVAETESVVLEIRWQGLKLLKQDPAFRERLDERYRAGVLRTHLRESRLFRFVPDEQLEQVVAATRLEQFGDLEWYAKYRRQFGMRAAEQIASEPMIAEEGQYAGALWIVRSGFARLSRRQGAGHRTLAYLGKGQYFGLREIAHARSPESQGPPLPYQESLRAIGYVDVLQIPKQIVLDHVLPFVRASDLPKPIESPRYEFGQPVLDAPLIGSSADIETGLLEFLVDQRLINGRQAMMIDLSRCTRCDDCVRACAKSHAGTPVFVRQGPQYSRWMFAQACMHCEDPVCMIGCPTGAIQRDSESGLVQIDQSTCIGCKTCAESCPYENIRMTQNQDARGRLQLDQASGRPLLHASKCDLCSSTNHAPACQSACPHEALYRINLADVQQLANHVQKRAA